MTNVLITGIGGDIGLSALQIINRTYPNWGVFGSDTNDESAGAHLVNTFVRSVSALQDNYLEWLTGIVRKYAVDLVIPCSDLEIVAISQSGCGLEVPMIMANDRAIHIGSDKLITAQTLSQAGIPAPITTTPDQTWREPFPHVIKPRDGRGSRGFFISQSEAQDDCYRNLYPNSIFQEILTPANKEITCGLYRSRTGQIATIALRRHLNGGSTSWCEVIDDPRIRELCVSIAHVLELNGSINLQLIMTTQGPMIFEINPRFSSTVNMRDLLGFPDLRWSIEERFFGSEPDLKSVTEKQIAFRVPQAFVSSHLKKPYHNAEPDPPQNPSS